MKIFLQPMSDLPFKASVIVLGLSLVHGVFAIPADIKANPSQQLPLPAASYIAKPLSISCYSL